MKHVVAVIDRVSIPQIVISWFTLIIVFALVYFAFTFSTTPLLNQGKPLTNDVSGFGNAIYFSFITATTIGYGDIVPQGIAKTFAIVEILISITLLGLLISKLVTQKQAEVLEEIQELGTEESVHAAITELYIFRNDVKDIQEKLFTIKQKKNATELTDFEHSLTSLQSALKHLHLATPEHSFEEGSQETMHSALMTNSLTSSLSKLVELLETFNTKKIAWKNESITTTMNECTDMTHALIQQYRALSNNASNMIGEKLEDLNNVTSALEKLCHA